MSRLTPTIASRLEFFVLDSTTYLPVASLGHADVSASGYVLRSLNGKRTASTSVSLSSNAALTADVVAGQFITIDSARGHYAIDCPSGSANVAYDFTEAAVTFTAGHIVRPVVHEIENKINTALALYDGDGVATESTLSYTAVEANGANTLASLIYAVVQLTDASVSTMAADTRDAILNRVLAGNHTTSGTVGLLLQFLDALVSSRLAPAVAGRTLDVSASGAVTAELDSADQGLTPAQQAQIDRIESQTSKLSGTPVTGNGNVKQGGQIVLKHGDDHTVALGNPVTVPVDDVGGALHTLMTAVGVGNLSVVAIRGVDPASRVSGTVAALSYSSNVLTVTMEFVATETVKGVVGPAYNYDVIKTDTPTRTYFSGRLTLTRDAR